MLPSTKYMTQSRLALLYERYIAGVCSQSELEELQQYFESNFHVQELSTLAQSTWDSLHAEKLQEMPQERAEEIRQQIISRNPSQNNQQLKWWTIAAALLIISLSGILFFNLNTGKDKTQVHTAQNHGEIKPASNMAVLKLSNGKEIVLNYHNAGQTASKTGSTIQLDAISRLLQAPENTAASATSMNTITIPRGRQYNIILPDQTVVHLNAASELTFPSQFTGSTRKVNLVGEAYFEVAKNPKMPFKVTVNNRQVVEVLGTHFNIKANPDEESIFTTLTEGSVKVSSGNSALLLKPGQMSINEQKNSNLTVKNVNIEEVLAWQRGFFIFDNENIVDIMKNLSKWYDVEVDFQGDMTNINLMGNYSRKKSLNSLLKTIELSNKVKFNVAGRRVTVIAQ